ncbi:FUSC family protein [Streptacidiphilus melanogenes]|uniref:FUSC family protein n=1 Tax=Streptacidiphilus melanogenes TaxID=411235 RepID=UPI0005A6B8AA|nr:FUSC family protein [Streptacidiphilus melanogenes]
MASSVSGSAWYRSLKTATRSGLTVERATNQPLAALRGALGVAIALFGALALGGPAMATSAALGAQLAGMATFQRSYRPRPWLALATALALSFSTFVGYVVSPWHLLFLAVLAVWAFAAGMAWVAGQTAGILASMAVTVMIVAVTLPASVPEAAQHAGVIAAGGVIQALLVVLWPVDRWSAHREALAEACGSMADYARRLRHDPFAPFDPDPLMAAREAAIVTPGQARSRPSELAGVRSLVERLRPALAALADPRVGAAEEGRERDRARELLAAAAEILDAAARSIRSGEGAQVPERAYRALAIPDGGPVLHGIARHTALRLIGLLAEVTDALDSPVDDDQPRYLRRPGVRALLPLTAAAVQRNWTQRSPVMRHAVRVAVVVTLAEGLGMLLPFGHGYWAAMTVMMIMRPEFSQTYTRGVARLAGTVVGVGLASVVMVLAKPAPWVCGLLAVVAVGCAYLTMRAGYMALSALVSVYVVFLLSMDGLVLRYTAEERVGMTLLGGFLAFAAYALWPTWQTVRLPDRLADYIDAAGHYAAAGLEAFGDPSAHNRRALRDALLDHRAARAALTATEASAEAEPVRARGLRPSQLADARAAISAIGRTTMLIEAHVPTAEGDSPGATAFAAVVREQLAHAAQSVRAGAPVDLTPVRDAFTTWSESEDGTPPEIIYDASILTEAMTGLQDALAS